MRCLTPYRRVVYDSLITNTYRREDLNQRVLIAWEVWGYDDVWYCTTRQQRYQSLNEAKFALDTDLIALGYILLTNEQVEKLKILL